LHFFNEKKKVVYPTEFPKSGLKKKNTGQEPMVHTSAQANSLRDSI
jgi:hypothetical protein